MMNHARGRLHHSKRMSWQQARVRASNSAQQAVNRTGTPRVPSGHEVPSGWSGGGVGLAAIALPIPRAFDEFGPRGRARPGESPSAPRNATTRASASQKPSARRAQGLGRQCLGEEDGCGLARIESEIGVPGVVAELEPGCRAPRLDDIDLRAGLDELRPPRSRHDDWPQGRHDNIQLAIRARWRSGEVPATTILVPERLRVGRASRGRARGRFRSAARRGRHAPWRGRRRLKAPARARALQPAR